MDWAHHAKEKLSRGETAQVRPRGNSMVGRIGSGQLVTIEPCDAEALEVDEIVLVRVKGRTYLHLVKAKQGVRMQIGNNRGGINGWVGPQAVYGRVVKIED